MEDHILLPFSIILILILILLKLIKLQHPKIKTKTSHNPPPSPPTSLPILGHLHHLLKQNQPLHRSLSTLSSLHGPILSLRLASRQALLISSLSTATECFSSHNDIVFANRPHLFAGKHLGYNYTTIAWASYGPHWRNLRRLTTLELFSTLSLNSSSAIRRDEVLSLVKSLVKDNKKVVLKPKLFELTLNIMMRMIAGKRYFGEDDDDDELLKDVKKESERFRDIVEETFRVSGGSNLCDFLPFLRLFSYGRGMTKRIVTLHEKRDAFLQEFIDKHREKQRVIDSNVNDHFEGLNKSVVDVLLGLQVKDPEYYTDDIIKGVVVMMLTAGTDTSAVTIEWAMSLLLNHPEVLTKVEEEIMMNIGKERFVSELDLSNLSFLQCVIYETLRLKPPAPIIPAHESSEDCTISGFHVPRGTMLLVNAWAMQRDPEVWVEPNKFQPERWLGKGLREERQKMLPFGIGRRSCPGEGLAMKVVGLTLAALIQCFAWGRVGDELVDLHEGPGLTMPKASPLVALCEPRSFVYKNIL